MAKKPRLAGEELFHYIYARGDNRHSVFKADFHYTKYIEFLKTHVHLFIFCRFRIISKVNKLTPAPMSGDTERQAILRDKHIKKAGGVDIEKNRYISKIFSILKPNTKLLDIGCGTGHIIQTLALNQKSVFFVGFDISSGMLRVAQGNTQDVSNVILVEGDGLKLPFSECSFDTVITRLAEYSPQEGYRILKKGGHFLEYGLGPEADKEIAEFFKDRIEQENFCLPKNLKEWKKEVCENIKDTGLVIDSIEDYKVAEYYQNEEELLDIIEMVPLVKDFDREIDRVIVENLAKKYRDDSGIKTTWHYYVLEARRL